MEERRRYRETRGRFFLFLAFLPGFVTPVFSQDYSRAFQNLRDLGLPDVSGAQYGNVSSIESRSYGRWDPYASFTHLDDLELKGNAWRLPPTTQTTGKNEYEVVLRQKHIKTFTSGEPEEDSQIQFGKWTPSDLKEDFAEILKILDGDDLSDPLSNNQESAGNLLLFAAHLDAIGMKKEAGQLASKVLSNPKAAEDHISSAINLVGDAQYQIAMNDAFETGDWNAFATACNELVTRFGAGWKSSSPVSMLAKKAMGQSSKSLTLPEGKNQKEKQVISSLRSALQSFGKNSEKDAQLFSTISYTGLWILPDNIKLNQLNKQEEKPEESLLGIVTRNSKTTIPILIELLGDDTMIPVIKPDESSVASEVDRFADEENAGTFSRPATYADLAAAFLIPIIPGLETYNSSINEMRGRALDWWSEASGSDDLSLARTYFHSGTDEQVSEAISYLAKNGREEDFTEIENQIQDEVIEYSWQGFSLAKSYLEARGESGASFVETLEDRINEHLTDLKKTDPDSHDSSKDTFESGLDSLRTLVSSETAAELLAKIVSGETDVYTVQEALVKRLSQESRADAVAALLDAATAGKDPQTSSTMMQMLGYLEHEEPYTPVTHADKWLGLLDDNRETQGMTVAVTAAWNAESLADPDSVGALQALWQSAGAQCAPLIIERARARLTGTDEKDLPEFPSKNDVTPERGKALTKSLLDLQNQLPELRAELESLPLAERMWVTGEPRQPGKDEDEKVPPLVAAIEKAQFEVGSVEAPDGWDGVIALKGNTFTGAALLELIQTALEKADREEQFEIEIKRDAGFDPWTITISTLDPATIPEEKSGITDAIHTIHSRLESEIPFVALAFGDNYYRSIWVSDESAGKVDPNQKSSLENLLRTSEQIEKTMPGWFQAVSGFQRGLHFSLIGTTAAPEDEDEKEN